MVAIELVLNLIVPLLWAKPVVVAGVLVKLPPMVRMPEVEVKAAFAEILRLPVILIAGL